MCQNLNVKLRCEKVKDDLVGAYFTKLVFCMFNISWLAWNCFDIWLGTDLKFKFISPWLILDINILVLSANVMASEWLLISP
jgi:hypothetical protein